MMCVRDTGGKGTPRRKVVKKSQAASQGDDRKLQAALKKLNVTAVGNVEEVNMFKDDGNVLHFASPRGESMFADSRQAGGLEVSSFDGPTGRRPGGFLSFLFISAAERRD
jgi:hypothetical protein